MNDHPTDFQIESIVLRQVIPGDLPVFFEQQRDPQAIWMAAFTPKDPLDVGAFSERWKKILSDETIRVKTILYNGEVAGSVLVFHQFGEPEISYWLGSEYWGKGIATGALAEFLKIIAERPLYARAAKDNLASIRVLQKCGFTLCGEDKGFANARNSDVEEFIFVLSD